MRLYLFILLLSISLEAVPSASNALQQQMKALQHVVAARDYYRWNLMISRDEQLRWGLQADRFFNHYAKRRFQVSSAQLNGQVLSGIVHVMPLQYPVEGFNIKVHLVKDIQSPSGFHFQKIVQLQGQRG